MPLEIKVNNNYVSSGSVFFKTNGAWAKAKEGYVKVDDVWRKFFVSEFKDFFERTNASTLGTSVTGQTWSAPRGTWNISTGKAQVTTSKTTYPIALVDVGLTDFELQANEMVPGVGVVIRAESSTNWWALVGWNSQVAYTYSYCPQALVNQGYCIVDNICQQTICPGGYQTVTNTVQGACLEYAPDRLEGADCYQVFYPGTPECRSSLVASTTCQEQCIRTCQRATTTCASAGQNCIREDGRTQCYARPDICTTTYVSTCCDRDTVCTTRYTSVETCEATPGYWGQSCSRYFTVPGGCVRYGPDTYTYTTTCPGGTATQNVICGYPNCAQTGSRQVCPVAEQTATGYNYNYRLYLLKSINGTITVEQDFDIGENFTAVKVTANGPNLAINVFRANNYTNQIKVLSYSSFTSPIGSNFGLVGYASSYQDGNTIGSLEVKQLGA